MPTYFNFTSIVQDPDIDWRSIAYAMKQQVRLSVCSHTKETKGFFGDKWGCDRKKAKDDLCERPSSNETACLSWLSVKFDVNKETAEKVLNHLKDLDWISTYKCSAVFFHV